MQNKLHYIKNIVKMYIIVVFLYYHLKLIKMIPNNNHYHHQNVTWKSIHLQSK